MLNTCEVPTMCLVALRKESVDRNNEMSSEEICWPVALRKESVDRNTHHSLNLPSSPMSLSARRAWIEMDALPETPCYIPSLSARRAWIEIILISLLYRRIRVALRKESVDRNVRPPAGPHVAHESLSARRAWIEIGRAL